MSRPYRTHRLVVALLVVASLLPFGAPAVAERGTEDAPDRPQSDLHDGWILIPTHPLARAFSAGSLVGITHDIFSVRPDAPFRLEKYDANSASVCLGLDCVATGDFDIVFLSEQDDGRTTLLARYASVGPEEGRVPKGASLAIVHLTTPGPDPGLRGHHYLYAEGNPGGDEIPKRK